MCFRTNTNKKTATGHPRVVQTAKTKFKLFPRGGAPPPRTPQFRSAAFAASEMMARRWLAALAGWLAVLAGWLCWLACWLLKKKSLNFFLERNRKFLRNFRMG